MKNRKSAISYEQRKQLLESIRYVALVISEENWDQKITDVKDYRIDVFVMEKHLEGKIDFLKKKYGVVYLPRAPEISTS